MKISTKRPLLNGRRLGCLLGVVGLLVSTLSAQVADDAISVPVHFQAMYDATATGNPELPAHMNVYATGVSGSAADSATPSGGASPSEAASPSPLPSAAKSGTALAKAAKSPHRLLYALPPPRPALWRPGAADLTPLAESGGWDRADPPDGGP
jgi:hypothetical protein